MGVEYLRTLIRMLVFKGRLLRLIVRTYRPAWKRTRAVCPVACGPRPTPPRDWPHRCCHSLSHIHW